MSLRDEWEAMTPEQRQSYADPKRACIESGCDEPAGTPWGPYWCADHDDERMRRITRQLNEIARSMKEERRG